MVLQIEYESERIEEYFNDLNKMKRKIGAELTKAVKKRYDQLKAAKTFQIYLSTGLGRPHKLDHDLSGYYGIGLSGNERLIVRPKAEGLEPEVLMDCDTVIIKGVEDYHGKKQEWLIH